MALVQGSLGGVAGGVSQQPDILRRPGQCSDQTNMLVDVVNGLRKRGRVDLIGILDAAFTSGDAYFHWFSLEGTDYVAVFTATGVTVYDFTGASYTVTVPAYSYLSAGFDSNNLSSAQVGEYNIIANSIRLPAMSTSVDDDGDEYVTFHVSDGMAWGVRYVIRWDGSIIADYTAPDGSTVSAATTEQITSLYIATSLFSSVSSYATPLGWIVVQQDNVIIMHRPAASYQATGAAPKWTLDDSVGGRNGSCTINEVQTLDDLPPKSWPGHWVRIGGKETSSLDDFYMMYKTDDGTSSTSGIWRETHDPTETSGFDATTMPHALINTASGGFYFTPLNGATLGGSIVDEWASRTAGDSSSNPIPAFIGRSIYDLTIVQQRLVVITDDHVNMSRAQREFTWWAQSALSDNDTDPIEQTTPGERVAHLFAAEEHEQNLLVLGNKKQFAIPLKQALTRSTASLVPTTSYDVDRRCQPCSVARGLFFAFSDGVRSGVREYQTVDVETIHEAEEVSSHLGDYLPVGLKELEADRQNNTVMVLPYTGKSLYVYQFLYQDQQRVVSAWSKIDFSFITPKSIMSLDGHFYIIGQCSNGLGLYRLEKDATLFLDYSIDAVIPASGTVDFTGWKFATCASESDITAILATGPYAGLQVQIESYSAGTFVLKEKSLFEGETLTLGVKFNAAYSPTMPVLRDKNGKAVQVDMLNVNTIEVTVQDSGDFDAVLSAEYYDATTQSLPGRRVGSTFIVGEYPVSSRTEKVSIGHDARACDLRFVSDSHQDLIIQALEYSGAYTRRGLRL